MVIEGNFKVLIVDDEPGAQLLLKELLEELNSVKIVGIASDTEEALYKLVECYPDLILLDISLPGITGIEFVELIHRRHIDIPVVFVSAHKKYVIEAIRNGIYDFLPKPVDRDQLKSIINKYERLNNKALSAKLMDVLATIKEDSKIRINSKNSYILINPDDIVYCNAKSGYTALHLTNNKIEIANTALSQIELKLQGHDFYRLGRSLLINCEHLRSIDKNSNVCYFKFKNFSWEVKVPHDSLRNMLKSKFNYA